MELNRVYGIFSLALRFAIYRINASFDSLFRLLDRQHQKLESKLVDSSSGYRLKMVPLQEREKLILKLQEYASELLAMMGPSSNEVRAPQLGSAGGVNHWRGGGS